MRQSLLFFLNALLLFAVLGSCQSRNNPTAAPTSLPHRMDSLTIAFLARVHTAATTSSTDSLVTYLAQALRHDGVDTLLYYRSGCVGCEVVKEKTTCWYNTAELRAYLFWQRAGRTFAKQLDCCSNHPAVATSAAAFAFYFQHRQVLDEGPSYFRKLERYNRTHPGQARFLPPSSVHGEQRYIRLWVGTQEYELEHTAHSFEADSDATEPLAYAWRQRQREWVRLLEQLPIVTASPPK
jgi:hypothetical protein